MAESTGSAPCPWAPLSCARSNGPSPVTHFPPPPPCGISGTDLEGGLGGHFEFLCKFSVPPTVPVFRIQDGRNRRREPGCKSEGKEGRRPRRHLQSRHPGGALRPGWSQATHGEVGGGRGQEVCLAGAGRPGSVRLWHWTSAPQWAGDARQRLGIFLLIMTGGAAGVMALITQDGPKSLKC